MTKVTLTIETEVGEDPRQALARFLALPADGKSTAATSAGGATGEWTAAEFTGLWRDLAPDAQRILAEIAKRPDGYPMADIQRTLGWTGLQLAGRLSSVGH